MNWDGHLGVWDHRLTIRHVLLKLLPLQNSLVGEFVVSVVASENIPRGNTPTLAAVPIVYLTPSRNQVSICPLPLMSKMPLWRQ